MLEAVLFNDNSSPEQNDFLFNESSIRGHLSNGTSTHGHPIYKNLGPKTPDPFIKDLRDIIKNRNNPENLIKKTK